MQSMADFTNMTERLALMPDPALQQFAQMHRDDPFTLALAVSESNRRKKMRTAQQGVAGMQQQPPVADQEIAQMNEPAMPENVGIGALPAPVLAGMPAGGIAGEEEMEPQTMAGGGLVAFADGGNVERYQSRGLVQDAARSAASDVESPAERARRLVRMAQARAAFSGPVPFTYGLTPGAAAAGLGVAGIPIGIAGGLTTAIEEMREQGYPVDEMGEFATEVTPEQRAFDAARVAKTRALDTPAATRPATQTPSPTDPNFRRLPDPRMAGITLPDLRSAAAARSAAPGAGSDAGPDAAPGAGAPPRAAGFDMTPAGLIALRRRLGETINVEEPANMKTAREALDTERLNAATARKAAIERDQAKFADAFKGREERLGKREADISKQRGENTGLAFLNAGLAIMSTPGGLATALGKGARVGTEQYASGLEKLRSAQDKLAEARDRLDDLKLNRAEMSAKEIRDAEDGINTAKIEGKKSGVEALANMYNISNKRADTMFNTLADTGLAIYREQQANLRNAASVGATKDAADATREATAAARLPVLLETTRKNIAAEAIKKYPFDAVAREQYETTEFAKAIRTNPALAQYVGAAGGGGAPAAAVTHRLNPATGKVESVR
jgi:hypothetical protein